MEVCYSVRFSFSSMVLFVVVPQNNPCAGVDVSSVFLL